MSNDLINFSPLYVTNGNILSPLTVSGDRYTFQRIRFSEMKVMPFPENGDTDWIPENLQQVLCFQNIGDILDATTLKDCEGEEIFLNQEDIQKQPCGFITSSKSIVPQIICPWNYGVNKVILEENSTKVERQECLLNKECLWRMQDTNTFGEKRVIDVPIGGHANTQKTSPTSAANIIVMTGPRRDYDDVNTGIFDRIFVSDLPEAGFYALNLDFLCKNTLPKKNNNDSPYVEIIITDTQTASDGANEMLSSHADSVLIKISPHSETKISINDKSSASGSISFDDQGFKVPFSSQNGKSNILFIYSLLNKLITTGEFSTDPESPSKEIKCSKNPDLDFSEIASPSFEKFPKKHKQGKANSIFLKDPTAYVSFGKQITVHWHNCYGTFGLIPIRYFSDVKFSYFYRVSGQTQFQKDGADAVSTSQDYFGIEYGVRYPEQDQDTENQNESNINWKNLRTLVYPTKISYNEKKQSTLYRADFNIPAKEILKLQKYPFEIFSLILISKRSGRLTGILNNDGNFSSDFHSNVDASKYNSYVKNSDLSLGGGNDNWMRFITSISVSHSLDGSSGSINLDKYMMMDLGVRPEQVIGALTLVMHNGFYNSDGKTINGISYNYNSDGYYPPMTWGQIFRGYALEIQDSLGDNNSSLSIKLEGIQRKLKDMTLLNAPCWDGDDVFGGAEAVMSYLISYSGCDLRYVNKFSNGLARGDIFLPRSSNWEVPAVYFPLGTTVYDAINQIGVYINHKFVIQPDGRGYFYYLNDIGLPTWVGEGPIRMRYKSKDIISLSLSPHLENKYNTFLTLGLLGENNSDKGRMDIVDSSPGYKMSCKNIQTGDFPWSKITTNKENGIVTISELEDRHKTNERFARASIYEGNVTVPGFHGFYLYDKISIDDVIYYIIGINHSISLQNKEWTTSLQLGKYEDTSGSYERYG